MLRAMAMFSLGGVFLMISPNLCLKVWDGMGAGVSAVDSYAPYSYILGAILVFITVVVAFNRGARAR